MFKNKLKFAHLFIILSVVFTSVYLYSYNNSTANDCSDDPQDDHCHCQTGYHWDGNWCVADTTNSYYYYCPDADGQAACEQAHPNLGDVCQSDTGLCPAYAYCNSPTADDYDQNGGNCALAHSGRVCIGTPLACNFTPITYCSDPEAINHSTQADCEAFYNPHTCTPDDNVCAYNCTGSGCPTDIGYCPTDGFVETDINGVRCEATKPSGSTCIANPYMCVHPRVTQPSTCQINASVVASCSPDYSYTGTFAYSYAYRSPEVCSATLSTTTVATIQNYLEGQICGGSSNPTAPSNVDWCTNLPGVQSDPAICLDQCSNIQLIQLTVPSGMTKNADGTCYQTSSDVCLNISDVQPAVPEGYIQDEFGDCLAIDICPTVPENQAVMPSGHCFSSSGECVPDVDNDQCGGGGASCGTAAGVQRSSSSFLSGTTACSSGVYGGYVALDTGSNRNRYMWGCYGNYNTFATCYANKGPVCGDATGYTWLMDVPPPGSISNLCASGNSTTTPVLVPKGGDTGTWNWNCGLSSLTASCTADALHCSAGQTYFPRCGCATVCPDLPVTLTPKLKTNEIVNKDQPCKVFLDQAISDANANTLCVLKNMTKGTIPLANFKPADNANPTYETLITQDTIFQLTCGDDAVDPNTGVGNGILDANEVGTNGTAVGSCRLNIRSAEFN